jgi:MraZ protein
MTTQGLATEGVQYLGKHSRGVDKSRRVMLPMEWRTEGYPSEFMVLLWPATGCDYLLVLPPERWRQMLANLGNISLTNEPGAVLERYISSNSYPRSLDSYGRLPIPEEAAKAVGIEDEAMLLGRMNKFEIWSPERLRASSQKAETLRVLETFSTMQL